MNAAPRSASAVSGGLARPPRSLLRLVGRAIGDFRMIGAGDRILLGVSGGKDSLALLHILAHLRRRAPVRFELGVLSIDPVAAGAGGPAVLKEYYQRLGLTWHYEEQALIEQARARIRGDAFCAYCARMKRGIMYRVCREQGYNVLALGQHLDDLAESLLMSLFHGGQLRTMKAHYRNDAGDVRIIRPLVYCRERQTAAFAARASFPIVADCCPARFFAGGRRQQMKELLAREEAQQSHLFASLLHAMRPIMTEGELPQPGWPTGCDESAGP